MKIQSDIQGYFQKNLVFDKQYYRSLQPEIPIGKEVEHFLNQGATERRSPNPVFMFRHVYKYNLSASPVNLFLNFLKLPVTDSHTPHSNFDFKSMPLESISQCSNYEDLLTLLMLNPPTHLHLIQIFSMLGGGRGYANKLASHLYGNYLIDQVAQGIPDRGGYAFSGHLWALEKRFEGCPPNITTKLLEQASMDKIKMIMIIRHPIDSLLSNFFWFQNSRKSISSDNLSIEDSLGFFTKNIEALVEFSNNGAHDEKYPSFNSFLDESRYFYNKRYIHKWRLEDFSLNTENAINEFLKAVVKDTSLPVTLPAIKPKAIPYRYKYLLAEDKVGKVKEFILYLLKQYESKIVGLGYQC